VRERGPHDPSPGPGELPCPPERDQVGFTLQGKQWDDLLAPADPNVELDDTHAPGAVPSEELLRPRGLLVLWLVGEGGKRAFLVNVEHHDFEVRVRGDLDDAARRERARDGALE